MNIHFNYVWIAGFYVYVRESYYLVDEQDRGLCTFLVSARKVRKEADSRKRCVSRSRAPNPLP